MKIIIKLTNGVGNNLFQYNFARLVCERQGGELFTDYKKNYYGIKFLQGLGLKILKRKFDNTYNHIYDNDIRFLSINSKSNLYISGYFEDYTIFGKYLDKIRSWFKPVSNKNYNDLVLHIRLGDRLLYKRDFCAGMRPSASEFLNATKLFSYNKLHIVTDMKKWGYLNISELERMKFHRSVSTEQRVNPKRSVDYMNSLVEEFKPLNPVIRAGMDVLDDFNYIRSFDKILFQHSTMAWWAAVLSHANYVGVYAPWRPVKGKRNKNLGHTNYSGWFNWNL